MLQRFLTFMRAQGWSAALGPEAPLTGVITGRYHNLPELWLQFIREVQELCSGDEMAWFLCAEDYNISFCHAWRWNEWEMLSLENAEGDEAWSNEIKAFWDNHLPIVLSLRDGYAYYAISMPDGAVVYGIEPEFEECTQVAGSFGEFLEGIMDGSIQI